LVQACCQQACLRLGSQAHESQLRLLLLLLDFVAYQLMCLTSQAGKAALTAAAASAVEQMYCQRACASALMCWPSARAAVASSASCAGAAHAAVFLLQEYPAHWLHHLLLLQQQSC
jgi:hypothetical protein